MSTTGEIFLNPYLSSAFIYLLSRPQKAPGPSDATGFVRQIAMHWTVQFTIQVLGKQRFEGPAEKYGL